MMLGNKYLMDARFHRAREEFFRCYSADSKREDALLLALFCCAKIGDLSEGRRILNKLVREGNLSIEAKVPETVDETFVELLESFIEDEDNRCNLLYEKGKISFDINKAKDRR
jgi:hypothetical protein